MRRTSAWIAIGAVWAAAAPAQAQTPAEGPRTQVIRAVERGAFVQATVGGSHAVGDGLDVGLGGVVAAHVGFDLGPVVNLAFGGTIITAGSGADRTAGGGDLLWLAPTMRLEVALLTTERLFFRVRGEGGYAFARPDRVDGRTYGDAGPILGGAAVLEYFTQLRHFSVGVSAGALGILDSVAPRGSPDERASAVSIQLTPHVKYTF